MTNGPFSPYLIKWMDRLQQVRDLSQETKTVREREIPAPLPTGFWRNSITSRRREAVEDDKDCNWQTFELLITVWTLRLYLQKPPSNQPNFKPKPNC
ncbi:hypothetical protein ACB092_01G300600 [Castanea dentata]